MDASISKSDRSDMEKLRKELSDCLPPDLDTDFNIFRWVHGWQGKIQDAARRFRIYIENRRAAGLDDPNFGENFYNHRLVTKLAPHFAFSLTPDMVNPLDNSVVTWQRFAGVDYHVVAKMVPCGEFLIFYCTICEWTLRRILKQETESGRRSGLTLVCDMENFAVLHYANPQSAIYKIFILCLGILQDYYCDILHRMIVINAPSVISIVLRLLKKFLSPVTQEKIVLILNKNDLPKFLHPSVIPVHDGGQWRLESNSLNFGGTEWRVDPDACTAVPKPIVQADLFVPKKFFEAPTIEHVQSKQSHVIRRSVTKPGAKLVWQFTTNGDIQFGVYRLAQDGQKIRLTPFWTLATPKVPEEGSVTCPEAAEYALEFFNDRTGWLSTVKVEFFVVLENE